MQIKPSTRKGYKLMAVFDNPKKTIHFGQAGASDYTQHGDKARRARYLARHRANEDWGNARTAGALSRWILWGNSTDVQTNIRAFKKKFGLK